MQELMEYYDRRATDYEETIRRACGTEEVFGGAREEGVALHRTLAGLPAGSVLDVACGTGLFTRPLRGPVVALDQSRAMLQQARGALPRVQIVQASALVLPFATRTFDRVVTSYFYGHLQGDIRAAFVEEALRVARELVVVDSALNDQVAPEEWQNRALSSGARYRSYKRHFTPASLIAELGGGVLFSGRWFLAVRHIAQ